jgi:hypothetical protein
MARVTLDRDVNFKWRPSLAPFRSHEVLICGDGGRRPGTALPAGEPIEIPSSLAYVFAYDMAGFGYGVTWLEDTPDVEELEAQRATAERYSPTGTIPEFTITTARSVRGS